MTNSELGEWTPDGESGRSFQRRRGYTLESGRVDDAFDYYWRIADGAGVWLRSMRGYADERTARIDCVMAANHMPPIGG